MRHPLASLLWWAVALGGTLGAWVGPSARAEEAFEASRFADQYALIYAGPSAGEGCPEALARVVRDVGLEVKYVKQPERIPKLLKHAAIFIVGGTTGDMEPIRTALTADEVGPALRKYLKQGGRYWGTCGGGYLAAQSYLGWEGRVPGLALIPARAEDYSSGRGGKLENVTWRGSEQTLYLHGSPSFRLVEKSTPVEILGKFADGQVAALLCSYAKAKSPSAARTPKPPAPGWKRRTSTPPPGSPPAPSRKPCSKICSRIGRLNSSVTRRKQPLHPIRQIPG